jgi:hypothetical protein
MFEKRSIIFFESFIFKNGSKPKPKYFLVLHTDSMNTIVAVLPSSQDFTPTVFEVETGCIINKSESYNCYKINKNEPVTECLKKFKKDTFLYSVYLETYDLNYIHEKHAKYELFGLMQVSIYKEIINCFINSPTTKNKYKKILTDLSF